LLIYQFWHTTTSSQPSSDNKHTSYLQEELQEMNESNLVNHHYPGPGHAAAPAATAKVLDEEEEEDDDDDLMSIDASVGTMTVARPTDPASEAFLSLLLEIIMIALSQWLSATRR
jgi:hypothetical protein